VIDSTIDSTIDLMTIDLLTIDLTVIDSSLKLARLENRDGD
jgi:hypothetical protein